MNRKTIPAICEVCKTPFPARLDKVKQGEGKTCSKHCSASIAAKRKNELYPKWGPGRRSHHPRRQSWYQYAKRYDKKHPRKVAAHLVVKLFKKYWGLKVKPCKSCGSTKDIHAHHEDYSKPLKIIWLCRKCHVRRHNNIKKFGK